MIGKRPVTGERSNAFGVFRVHTELGPSGSVYLALDPSTNSTVVVHAIEVRGDRQRTDAAIQNSLRTLCTANVGHRSIARPIASGLEAGTPYLVYPRLTGATIEAIVQRDGAQPLAEVVRFLTPVASAIDAAAATWIHHGALTPADIVVNNGSTAITRFGLVDVLRHAGLDVVVQPAYASPARLAGAPPTLADDVYSLAAIALHLIAGKGVNLRPDRLAKRVRGPRNASSLTATEEDVLRTLVAVDAPLLRGAMSRALSDNPSSRQPSATELVKELRRAIVQQKSSQQSAGYDDSLMAFGSEVTESPTRAPVVPIIAPLSSPALIWSEAVPVVPAEGLRQKIAIALLVLGSVGAAIAGGLFVAGRYDVAPPAQETPAATPVMLDVPTATQKASPAPPPDAQPAAPIASPAAATRPADARPGPAPTEPVNRQQTRQASPPPPVVDVNAPGALFANSNPTGARLFVDDALVGTTPLLLSGLSPGSHQVRLELSGFRPSSTVIQIEPNKRFRLQLTLEQN